MNYMKKAQLVYDNLTTLKLDNGSERVIWREDADIIDLQKEWQEFTGKHSGYNFSELDEYYNILQMLTSYMSGYDEFTLDNLYECDWRDDYNYDRLKWLQDNMARLDYYQDVKDNGAENLIDIIGDMQDMHRHDIAYAIFTGFLGGSDE